MAGIGFTLERLAKSGSLYKSVSAYFLAAFVVSGPWIMTVLGVAGLGVLACETQCLSVQIFRSVIIYNSLFSLIVTAPIAYVGTRFISDDLYSGRTDRINLVLVCSLAGFTIVSAMIGVPFYMLLTSLNPIETVASLQNLGLLGTAWLLIPFLGVLKGFKTVMIGFLGGTILMLLIATKTTVSSFVLLTEFNAGLCFIDLLMLLRICLDFGIGLNRNIEPFLLSFIERWELPAIGITFGLGLWIDKWIIWHKASIGVLHIAGALQTMPSYDTPMFWAQLSTLPAITVFFIHIETDLYRLTRYFNSRVLEQATLSELEELTENIAVFASRSILRLVTISVAISALGIIGSFVLIDHISLRANQMGILRNALIGAAFQNSAMFCFIFLLYLDLRKQALFVTALFCFLNGSLTFLFLPLGFYYYGIGTAAASVFTFLAAFLILSHEVRWLLFHLFVTNNGSLR